MIFCILVCLFINAESASVGSAVSDALGICALEAYGATVAEDGTPVCPNGMHLVAPATRSDAYVISTADLTEGPTTYVPNEVMDIHIRVLDPMKKYLGLLIYAVQDDGVITADGCPSPGCDGRDEVKVGQWEMDGDKFFRTLADGQAMTHREATLKNYHHVLRWRAPEQGTGDVIFRVLIKQGATNGGAFYWPMIDGDLVLQEDSITTPSPIQWLSGVIDQTCSEICESSSMACDRNVNTTGNFDLYDEVKKSAYCQLPLLSSCTVNAPSIDADGYCWFENKESGLCDTELERVNICDSFEVAGGDSRLCPCMERISTGNGENGGVEENLNGRNNIDDGDNFSLMQFAIGFGGAASVILLCVGIVCHCKNRKINQPGGVIEDKIAKRDPKGNLTAVCPPPPPRYPPFNGKPRYQGEPSVENVL